MKSAGETAETLARARSSGPTPVNAVGRPSGSPSASASPHPAGLANVHPPAAVRARATSFFLLGSSSFTYSTSSPCARLSAGNTDRTR